ncbi:MAG: dihydroorotase, partial [Psychromonas sp.]
EKSDWNVPASMSFGDQQVVPIKAAEKILWKVL